MSRYLQIFQIGKRPARFTAFEFDTDALPPIYRADLITWGTSQEYTLPDLALVLHARGWLLSDIAMAFEAAGK